MQAAGSTEPTYNSHQKGSSAVRFKPSFFDESLGDVQSIKFVSNLLGLDDGATVKYLEDDDQWKRKRAPERNDDGGEDSMRGNDPAWIIVGSANWGYY
jgi:2-hydroxychromene-2-carboxylate isomerase